MAQRQQAQAQALQSMTGQANLANTQANTAQTQGETNRAQSTYDKAQKQEQEVQQAVQLVSGVEEGSPQYDTAMASALATLKTPEQTIKFRDALRARGEASLMARRRRLYGGLLQNPTLGNLTRAYEVALTNRDEEAARQFANIISSHGYLQDPNSPMEAAKLLATQALARQRDAAANRPAGGRSGGPVLSHDEQVAQQVRMQARANEAMVDPRRKIPRYPTAGAALRAAIAQYGAQVTPGVRRLLALDPDAIRPAAPAPATGSLAERNRRRAALNLPPVTQ
jgi:hypothetical protein